jgi:serine protease Do
VLAVRTVKPSVVNIIAYEDYHDSSGKLIDVNSVTGTGIIINQDGTIVSNNHVVANSKLKYTVIFADGTSYEAKILGQDMYSDVALLKIDAKDLPAAKLGDSNNLETGQSVFAIGNSLGKYQNTVTRGVVSGLSRAVDVEGSRPRMLNLIQTDAAINPGNSGGPLINMAGEVVGVNTLIDTEGEGIGFAIPIDIVKDSVAQLLKFGKVSRPYLGITFQTIDPAFQKMHQLDQAEGAYVATVADASPAFNAKLSAGDVIIAIDREKLTQTNQLDQAVNRHKAGDQVLVTYVRSGQQQDVPVVLAEFK